VAVVAAACAASGCGDGRDHATAGRDLVGAASAGDVAGLARLLDSGVPVDATDDRGATALLAAVAADRRGAVQFLLDRGADVNAQAANRDSPWLLAGAEGRAQMLEAMLPHGPDLARRNRFGGNALIPACERGHVAAVRVLLRTTIDLDHVNDLGWTCLLELVVLGDGGPRHREVARLVLDAGADPNVADRNGVTPLTHARRRGQSEVAALLDAAGGR
jgi:hypothetical protein